MSSPLYSMPQAPEISAAIAGAPNAKVVKRHIPAESTAAVRSWNPFTQAGFSTIDC